jgi:RNA polymerase sigma-70 factor (ECF subfamily)
MSDGELVGGILKGLVDFAVLMDRFQQQVHRWIYAVVGPGADYEELTQCVFFRAYKRLDRFDPAKGSLCTWLHRITHNVAVSFLRQRNRAPDSLDAMTEDEAPTCSGPVEEYAVKALRERLYRAIQKLAPRRRHAFVGHHVRGLTWEEVAAEMDCCEHTARILSAQAAEQLRKELR